MKKKLGFLVICAIIFLFIPQCIAEILNPGFELYEPNSLLGLDTPLYWETENYVQVHESFVPQPEHEPNSVEWTIPESHEGDLFVLLSTGDLGDDEPGPPSHARISQQTSFLAGQTISGFYFFGTCDWYNDTGVIKLIPDPNSQNPPPRAILLVERSVSDPDIGASGSTEGWVHFDYTFNEATAGDYFMVCEVNDAIDEIYKTYLAVDALVVGYPPEYGDIYIDFEVNYRDLALFADDWNKNCDDPNNTCYDNTDMNGDDFVDTDDLILMGSNWLWTQ